MKVVWLSRLLPGLGILWAQTGAAAPSAEAPCVQSAQQGREHVQAGRLRRARSAYLECAQASCGASQSQQCRSALQQLDVNTPTVVPVATDPKGALQLDVSVSMDGELLTSKIDGRSIEVDPGMHEFSFRTAQGGVRTEKVLILEGQRNRVLSVLVGTAAAPPDPSRAPLVPAATKAGPDDSAAVSAGKTSVAAKQTEDGSLDGGATRASPVLAYTVGAVGLAAVGTSLLLAHWGHEDNLRLDQCAPNCTQESVDHVRHMYIAADITLGVGIVALGTATWLYFSRPEVDDTSTARAYHFDVRPTASGAFATVGRAF